MTGLASVDRFYNVFEIKHGVKHGSKLDFINQASDFYQLDGVHINNLVPTILANWQPKALLDQRRQHSGLFTAVNLEELDKACHAVGANRETEAASAKVKLFGFCIPYTTPQPALAYAVPLRVGYGWFTGANLKQRWTRNPPCELADEAVVVWQILLLSRW